MGFSLEEFFKDMKFIIDNGLGYQVLVSAIEQAEEYARVCGMIDE